MTALSVPATRVSSVARGIADAESVGTTANAQAAKPISSKTFHIDILLEVAAVSQRGKDVTPRTERAAHLNGNEEGFVGMALWAFKGAQIETRFGRLDAGQPHRFAASGAVQNSDRYSAKDGIGLSGQHDAPL
jgi:hypothetical protein